MASNELELFDDEVRIEEEEAAANGFSFRAALLKRVTKLLSVESKPTRKALPKDDNKDKDSDSALRQPGLVPLAKGLADSFSRLGLRSVATLFKVQQASLFEDLINDRDYVMESLIQAVVKDSNGLVGQRGTEAFVKTLWEDLQHPPDNYLAGEFRFRTADGSNNSILHPQMGAAGQPYARTVKPTAGQSAVLPDPGVIFDCLLERHEPKEHPAKISSVLFYLATVIIHDLFRTDHRNFAYSKTSSYLDLAPLYGSSETELAAMRTGNDGKLHPDCFSETRLLMLPPGSGILLIMFNRFHNHVAEQLVAINENGRFDKPKTGSKEDSKEGWAKYDDEIFQTARLITCGLYVNIILIDYVRTILNLNRTESDWQLNPRIDIPDGPAMGVGNQVSAEFNLVYRWHSTVSVRDEQWSLDEFAKIFGKDRRPDEIPMTEFLGALGQIEAKLQKQQPYERQFGEFQRQPNGFYNDEQLVESITQSVDDCANAYGPRQVPAVLKAVEVLGMKQARSWNLATLNEFRKHFSLKPHEKWEDITTNKEVALHLKNLYKDVDNVELYPGLVVEDAKDPWVPGSGLCPPYTVSRAVLSDAVALVRGDRFYTTSYHPRILTNWGFAEADYDKKVDCGCVLYKLFQRAFPNHFDPDSIYSHYSFTQAKAVRDDVLRDGLVRKAHLYNTDEVDLKGSPAPIVATSYEVLHQVLTNPESYTVDLSIPARLLCPEKRNKPAFSNAISSYLKSGPSTHNKSLSSALLPALCSEFERDLQKHIKAKSYKLIKFNEVDIIQEVINKASARLAITLFDIPSGDSVDDACTESEIRDIFNIVAGTWSNFDRTYLTRSRQKASPIARKLSDIMLPQLDEIRSKLNRNGDYRNSTKDDPIKSQKLDILAGMFVAGLDKEQAFVATIVLASSFATSIAQHFSNLLDRLLVSDLTHLAAIRAFANDKSAKADAGFSSYARELARLSSETVSLRTISQATTLSDSTQLIPGQRILLSARTINQDATAFPSPDVLDFNRDAETYIPLDLTVGVADQVWQDMQLAALRSMLKVICGLPGLRPADVWNGTSGKAGVKKIPVRIRAVENGGEKEEQGTVQVAYLTEKWDGLAAFPTSKF
ncbi:heme peroxidase [Myriangium duriaei CBS 260.36]|uniref:Heme peroxidase n=1 Tax=Myriangium duriaei CBS 260.36 TaxID=1168546 RepID=A0A9P4J622_9PEZI|nr:heme peroxidase [Myriangium duriaei CBS 260.36]